MPCRRSTVVGAMAAATTALSWPAAGTAAATRAPTATMILMLGTVASPRTAQKSRIAQRTAARMNV
jgi:hypothetical protein